MKNLFSLSFLTILVFLAGCGNYNSHDKLGTELYPNIALSGSHTYNCSKGDYYDSIILDKKVEFLWDNEKKYYLATIPELCVKFIAQPNADQSLDEKQYRDKQAKEGLIVKNNSIGIYNGDIKIKNLYRFYNKSQKEDIDQTIQEEFNIKPNQNNSYTYDDKRFCYIDIIGSSLQDMPQIKSEYFLIYQLYTMSDVLTKEQIVDSTVGILNSQLCGDDYPMINIGFDRLQSTYIFYNEQTHPTQYVMYKGTPTQDDSLYSSIDVQLY